MVFDKKNLIQNKKSPTLEASVSFVKKSNDNALCQHVYQKHLMFDQSYLVRYTQKYESLSGSLPAELLVIDRNELSFWLDL
jgi:hypothetical protein